MHEIGFGPPQTCERLLVAVSRVGASGTSVGADIVRRVSDALELTIRFEAGDTGFVIASIPEVPGAISQGRTCAEARSNVIDALRLVLSADPDATSSHTEPLQLTIATSSSAPR